MLDEKKNIPAKIMYKKFCHLTTQLRLDEISILNFSIY